MSEHIKNTVLLINPPDSGRITSVKGATNLPAGDIQAYPPINLLYLAAYLKETRPDIQVTLKDYMVESFSEQLLHETLLRERPFLVGITCFSTSLYEAFTLCRLIKEFDETIMVMVGGPNTVVFPRQTIEKSFIDLVCEGEGEKALVGVVDCLLDGRSVSEIPNVWVKKGGEIVPPSRYEEAFGVLDDAPFPDLSLVNLRKYYHPFLFKGHGLIPVLTGRGCPFKCTFCNSSMKKPRQRSIENVVDEIERGVKDLGIRNVSLLDDTFNISKDRMISFAREIINRKLKFSWAFRGRVSSISEEAVKLAKQAGLVHISFGVEDYTDEGLNLIRKRTTIADIRKAFSICRTFKVQTTANFIIGLPHNQRWNKQYKLIDFIKELSPTTIQTFVLLLIPGSQLYDEAVKRGIISGKEWLRQVEEPSKDFCIPAWEENMSVEEQYRMNAVINRSFYCRAGYLFKRLFEVRSPTEVVGKTQTGIRLLRSQLKAIDI